MKAPYLAVLDVGHGNCAALVADDRVIVIDAGAKGCSLRQFLVEQGIRRVDAVVLSHADADHIGGVLRVLSKPDFEVAAVYVNPAPGRTTDAWNDLISVAREYENNGINVLAGNVDQHLNVRLTSDTVSIEVLAPTAADVAAQRLASQSPGVVADTNTLSAVVRVLAFGRPVALLCGDIDRLGFDALADRHPSIPSPILVFPHHGGNMGATGDANAASLFATALCRLAGPDVVLFSIGKPFANPLPEVVASVRASRPKAWIACTQLSKYCGTVKDSAEPEHWSPVHARGRAKAECCLGSLVVSLSPNGPSFEPASAAHQRFVQLRVSKPLCRSQVLPPNPDPDAMRVPADPGGVQETLDKADEAHTGADRAQAAGGQRDARGRSDR